MKRITKTIFILSIMALMNFLFCPAEGLAASVGPLVWSQLPSMESMNGYSFSSETQVPANVADDFLSTDEPIVAVTWWGSYYDSTSEDLDFYPYPNSDSWGDPVPNPPGTVSGFVISFYEDVPAGQGIPPWGHPGALVYSETLDMGTDITESVYGTITRPGSEETIFQYSAVLPEENPFVPQEDTTYWISIVAIDPDGEPVQWGWHESVDQWNANAVQIGYSPYGWWDLLPGEDMAFELVAIPLPGSVVLLLSGLAGILAVRRRNS